MLIGLLSSTEGSAVEACSWVQQWQVHRGCVVHVGGSRRWVAAGQDGCFHPLPQPGSCPPRAALSISSSESTAEVRAAVASAQELMKKQPKARGAGAASAPVYLLRHGSSGRLSCCFLCLLAPHLWHFPHQAVAEVAFNGVSPSFLGQTLAQPGMSPGLPLCLWSTRFVLASLPFPLPLPLIDLFI